MGKKKKREKHSGLSLSRIGASLVPGAIFAAVPRTAQSFSETWPRRKKNLSALSAALGSVGNLAQAIVVQGSRENINENAGTSNETLEHSEDYESEGHYAIVDENILQGRKDQSDEIETTRPPVEAIYAKVNKNRKSQADEKRSSSSSGSSDSEDDITSVSGMASEDEDSTTTANHNDSKKYSRKRNSKKRSHKDNLKKYSRRNDPGEVEEQVITQTDINDNLVMANPTYTEHFLERQYSTDQETNLQNEFLQTNEGTHDAMKYNVDKSIQRNFNSPTQFEREHFNETTLETYSDAGSPTLQTFSGASLSNIANRSLDVPPISERESPIGKGMSMESVHSYKDKWHDFAHSAKNEESMARSFERRPASGEGCQEELKKRQEKEKGKHKKKKKKQKQVNDEGGQKPQQQQHLQLQQEPQQLQQQPQQLQEHQQQLHQENQRPKRFSQSAELVRQQTEVANKLRALSSQGSFAFEKHELNVGDISKDAQLSVTTAGSSEPRVRIKEDKKTQASDKLLDSTMDDTFSHEHGKDSERYQEKRSSIKQKKKRKSKEESFEVMKDMEAVDNSQGSTLKQMSTAMAKEACRQLYLQVKTLDREKSVLETLSQSLNEENTTLKKLNESLTMNADNSSAHGTSLGLLQTRIEELKQENNFLKDSVRRLNIELVRYQAKHRPLSTEEAGEMFKTDERQPAWLVNKKYIAPLFLAYDDRIKEKQTIIETYEGQLKEFKSRLNQIVEENVHLQERLGKSEMIMYDEEEWLQLEKQAQLVLSENELLMERQDLQNKKLEEVTAFYKGEVSRLSEQYEKVKAEKSGLESRIEVLNNTLNGYKHELETSSTQWKKHVSVEEHLDAVNECRRKLDELRKKTQEEIDSLNFQLESARNENNSLAMQLADFKLANTQLEREVYSFTEVQRKNERKSLLLKEKLAHLEQREATAQDTLNEVLKVAEKTTLERDALNEMLTSKQLENKKVQSLVKLEEDKLKECKSKASLKITAIKGRVKEQERATEILIDRYENEIKNLKTLIRRQQKQLEDMVNDKRDLENELNVIYEKVGNNETDGKDVG